jgi:hypothetical protein
MAVINLVIEAIGTTRSAFFTTNSREVAPSTTRAIFDRNAYREEEARTEEVLLGVWLWEAGGAVRVGGATTASPLWAPSAVASLPAGLNQVNRTAQNNAAAAKCLSLRWRQRAREETEAMVRSPGR